jgi:hypothetical protein
MKRVPKGTPPLVAALYREGVILTLGLSDDVPYEDKHFLSTPCTEAEGRALMAKLRETSAALKGAK